MSMLRLFIFSFLIAGILNAWANPYPIPSITHASSNKQASFKLVAHNLKVPWGMAFIDQHKALVTQRPGTVSLLDLSADPPKLTTIKHIKAVQAVGEGGLLGIAVDPKFDKTHWVYLYYTVGHRGDYSNKVVRYHYTQHTLKQPKVLVNNIPGARIHDGGRLRFGPDHKLYITTGDADDQRLAQDKSSLGGKILRINRDGSIPKDNPDQHSPVYSYGHRNPQGLAWDRQSQLWSTEHGSYAHDEINLIKKGNNYGWPVIEGKESQPGMQTPIKQSGRQTWAPSSAMIDHGSLYFTGLRSRQLYRFNLKTHRLHTQFKNRLGRLRNIIKGPQDKYCYLLTSNRDGRGSPDDQDDKILQLSCASLLS